LLYSDPLILALDSSGSGCSAAVTAGDEVLALTHAAMMHGQAEALLPIVDDAMRKAGLAISAIDLVAVTTGPGSFTGIRVGLAAARGIALAGNLPLIGASSFEATAAAVAATVCASRCLLVALESRRADLYIQLFERPAHPLSEPAAVLPDAVTAAVDAVAGARALAIAGEAGTRAAIALAGRPDTALIEETPPLAIGVASAVLRRWRDGERGGDPRPLYLRPPDVTPSNSPHAPRER
jgi:tRNA threonylcarbamoyladenosine biosynthesis protein TsaB